MLRNKDQNFLDVKHEIVERCVAKLACSGELNKIRTAQDAAAILTVLRDNFSWCTGNSLFTGDDLKRWFDEETRESLLIFIDVPSDRTIQLGDDDTFAVFYGSSNPTVESYGSSNPTVKSYDSSNPTVKSYDSSNPTVKSYDSSNPTVKSYDSSNPTVKSYGSGKKKFIPHHNSCIAHPTAGEYLFAPENKFKIVTVQPEKEDA